MQKIDSTYKSIREAEQLFFENRNTDSKQMKFKQKEKVASDFALDHSSSTIFFPLHFEKTIRNAIEWRIFISLHANNTSDSKQITTLQPICSENQFQDCSTPTPRSNFYEQGKEPMQKSIVNNDVSKNPRSTQKARQAQTAAQLSCSEKRRKVKPFCSHLSRIAGTSSV